MKPLKCMRNTLLCCAVPMTLLLCSCDGSNGSAADFSSELDASFSIRAEMTYGEDNSAELLLTRYEENHWDAAFETPSSLAGVVLTIEGEAVGANYKGLSFTVPKSALPAKAMLLLITDVMEELIDEETLPATHNEDSTWTVSGETESGSYTVTFLADGTLAGFSMPNQPLSVLFSDYKASGKTETTTAASDTTSSDSSTTTTTTSSAAST